MKRQMQRSMKKVERKFNRVKSWATSFVRSDSPYSYTTRHTYGSTRDPSPSSFSDSDDEPPVFEPTTPELPTERRTSVTFIPCEFCGVQQPSRNLDRHQIGCSQNPDRVRRRNLSPIGTSRGQLRRAISEVAPPAPSAPPPPPPPLPPRARQRSPSPTEGFTIPRNLTCPITGSLFRDPVVASDGHTYEREAITRWLKQEKISPITRQPMSVTKLNPTLTVRDLVDEFRTECKKKLLYKYKLDVDVKKIEQVPYIKTNTKSIYRAEWIKEDSSLSNSNIILIHLTGPNAEKIADINCRLQPHPNIIRTFGRVEHNDTGILLVQESPSTQTLSQFMNNSNEKLSIKIIDNILYQISSALQHLTNTEIIHGNIISDNIFIYQLDEILENTLVKLTNIYDIDNNKRAPESLTEKSDVYAFSILAQELYSLEFEEDNETYLTKRQVLFDRCLTDNPDQRPAFSDLTKALHDIINEKK